MAIRLLLILALIFGIDLIEAKKPPPARRHQTLISSVSQDSLTIQEDNGPKSFQITKFTEIQVDGQRVLVSELKPGMRVSVTLDDPTHLRKIEAWRTH